MKDKSKQWWRWLLFIPVGLLIYTIGVVVIFFIANYADSKSELEIVRIMAYFSQVFADVVILYFSVELVKVFCPKEKLGGIIFASFMLVLYAVVLGFHILASIGVVGYIKEGWRGLLLGGACMITCIISLVKTSKEVEEDSYNRQSVDKIETQK